MSASQEKKNRSTLRSEGTDKKAKAAEEKAVKDKKFRRNAIIIAVIAVVVIAAAIVINSNLFYTGFTAVTIGDTKYNAAEVSCYYRLAYSSIYNSLNETYGDLASYILSTDTPLDEQQYSADQTWADYIYEQTLDNMQQVTVLCKEAEKNGFTLPEENAQSVENSVATLQYYATVNGYPTLDSFLATNYGGQGVTEKVYRKVCTQMALADAYATHIQDSYTYSDSQLEDYYSANADDLDYFSYYMYYFSTSNERYTIVESDEEKAAKAHEDAMTLLEDMDVEDFTARAAEFSGSELTLSVAQGSQLNSVYRDWMLDPSRAEGDMTVIDNEGGSYAVCFMARENNDYNMVNMRHVLFNAVADENGNVTDAALEEAEMKANDVLVQYLADPTEDNFAQLANDYSEDTGSNTTGGLYENVIKHQMVDSINDFLFNEGSQPGDTTVVYGGNGSYEGYHAVLYVSDGENLRQKMASSAMLESDYNSYLETLKAASPLTVGSGMKFATVK